MRSVRLLAPVATVVALAVLAQPQRSAGGAAVGKVAAQVIHAAAKHLCAQPPVIPPPWIPPEVPRKPRFRTPSDIPPPDFMGPFFFPYPEPGTPVPPKLRNPVKPPGEQNPHWVDDEGYLWVDGVEDLIWWVYDPLQDIWFIYDEFQDQLYYLMPDPDGPYLITGPNSGNGDG
jgi:hypothetical protein